MSLLTFSQLGHMGRFGNQLSQIASTIGIAEKNGCEYIFPKWEYSKYFKQEIPQLRYGGLRIDAVLNEGPDFSYRDVTITERDKTIDLHGYWQSHKYFEHCKDKIKKYFAFKKEVRERTGDWNSKYSYCSLHVRRGDYLRLPDHHPVLTMDYYNKAMGIIEDLSFDKPIRYIVMSDDIKWCVDNFDGEKFIFSPDDEITDLCKATLCDYNIVANSSLSWWGAYLGRAENVIVPDKWFGKAYAGMDRDRFLPAWTII